MANNTADVVTPRVAHAPRFARARLVWHIGKGALILASVYRWSDTSRRSALVRAWSERLLALCGITLHVHTHGEVMAAGTMVASNHVSWLDIFAINAWRPTPFVAKSEIARWPVIGWMASEVGTVFIQRSRRSDAKRIVDMLSDILRNQGLVCLFPEGTTSDGTKVLDFHANILQATVKAGAPVQPLCLMYEDAQGRQSLAPAYVGDITLGETLRQVLACAPMTAHLHIGAPLHGLTHRREAATRTHEAVSEALRTLQTLVAPADAAAVEEAQRRTAARPPEFAASAKRD